MIRLENVYKEYGEGNFAFQALEDVNIRVEKGECMTMVGRSGCGKSTLLNIIAGLEPATFGGVYFQEERILGPRNEISIIFQNYGLFPWKTVYQNLVLPFVLKHGGKRTYEEKEKTNQILKQLDLIEHKDKYPCQLSGGQRQRVSVGRAILNEAQVILMDEPFGALDVFSREKLQKNMKILLKEKNITSILVTHSIREAVYMGDSIAIFSRKGKKIKKVIKNKEWADEKTKDEMEFNKQIMRVKNMLAGENDEKV